MGHAARTSSGERPREITQRRLNQGVVLTLDNQATAIQQTREFMADLSVRLDKYEKELASFEASAVLKRQEHLAEVRAELQSVAVHYAKFRYAKFWDRLRWVVLGS